MKMASQSDPMMQRWIYGMEELERQVAEKLIRLCMYSDMIPKEVLTSYSKVLLEALGYAQKEGMLRSFLENCVEGVEGLTALVKTLEKSEDPLVEDRGKRIREIMM